MISSMKLVKIADAKPGRIYFLTNHRDRPGLLLLSKNRKMFHGIMLGEGLHRLVKIDYENCDELYEL